MSIEPSGGLLCAGCPTAFFVWLLRVRVADWLTGWSVRHDSVPVGPRVRFVNRFVGWIGVRVRPGCLRTTGMPAVSGAACGEWGIGHGHGAARTDARGANLLGW